MSETDERFLERVREEADRRLGPGLDLVRIDPTVGDGIVRLSAIIATPAGGHVVEVTGSSIVDAAGELMGRLPEERLALAFRRLVAEEGYAKPHG
jgi:hypothetical protein